MLKVLDTVRNTEYLPRQIQAFSGPGQCSPAPSRCHCGVDVHEAGGIATKTSLQFCLSLLWVTTLNFLT